MTRQKSNRDFDAEVRRHRVEMLLNDAAEYTTEAEMPDNLVVAALSGERNHCASTARTRLVLCTVGIASLCLLIVGLPLTRRHFTNLASGDVLNLERTPIPAARPYPSQEHMRITGPVKKQTGQDYPISGKSELRPPSGMVSQRLIASKTSQTHAPKRATTRAHKYPPKAIWNDEIVQTREQGMMIPIVTVESVPNSPDPEVKSGMAVVPIRSGATRCESPTALTKVTHSPDTNEEK